VWSCGEEMREAWLKAMEPEKVGFRRGRKGKQRVLRSIPMNSKVVKRGKNIYIQDQMVA
jgi:hypothetical protein